MERIITPASKHLYGCHAGPDPASSTVLDSGFRRNDDFGIYCCRSNTSGNARHPALPLFGLLLLLPLVIAWADSWEGLREASGRITSIEARFVQKKTLPMLAKPFVSEGRFLYQTPGQLRWEYDRPVRSVLLMNGGTIKRYLREPAGWREETGASLTAMRVVMEEIANWQQGRFDANPHFQATLTTDPETRVTLVPKEASWGKMIRRIELTLSREQAGVMKGVRIVEDERSFTDLSFSQVRINRPLPGSLFVNVE
jgi:outer membrane lipoprotein carrier protein